MKLSIVAYQSPLREGSAPARALLALCEGLLELGHDLSVWSWGPDAPGEPLPPWARWAPVPGTSLKTRLHALIRPRADVLRGDWAPPSDAIVIADDVPSFPAAARSTRSVVTLHYLAKLEVRALRRIEPRDIQSIRADARVAREAALVTAYSDRVARFSGAASRAVVVPIAYPMPDEVYTPSDEPVAVLLANWRWRPNRIALDRLLAGWALVRRRVSGARLVLAGHGLDERTAAVEGVDAMGPVARAGDALEKAAVVAFPCPDTSGPKIKVIEALAYGIPVVTTPAGVEGLHIPAGAGTVVAPSDRFADALAELLLDPARRRELGRSGREAIAASHAAVPAARARVAALTAAFGD